MTTVLKGIKLRLYPNKQQQAQLCQMFGNDRFVWNQMLDMAKQRYQNNPSSQFVDQYGMDVLLKPLPFLKRSDSTSLQVVNHNLYQAFQRLLSIWVVTHALNPDGLLSSPILVKAKFK